MLRHGVFSLSLLLESLGIGVLGYHYLNKLNWIDSFLNASMILGSMGPVDKLTTDSSKIFASVFAIFSGVVFLVGAGVVFTPIAQRILHRMHVDEE
jgi:hypothetical protein